MAYDSVLFDLDGTLTDSAPGIINSIRHALERMQRPIPGAATLNRFLGPPLLESFARYCGLSPSESAAALVLYREYFTTVGLFENRVYEGVVPMLASLQARGIKLILATSKPEAFARRILDHFDLTQYFAAIHGATLDERRNRKADVIAWALAHSGNVARAIMVGDRANDIEGAQANSLESIGVLYGYGDEAELRNAGATFLASSPAVVMQICNCNVGVINRAVIRGVPGWAERDDRDRRDERDKSREPLATHCLAASDAKAPNRRVSEVSSVAVVPCHGRSVNRTGERSMR